MVDQSVRYSLRFAQIGSEQVISKQIQALGIFFLATIPCVAQVSSADRLNANSLQAAASYAQSLAQWAFITFGGSLLLLVGTSYYRPSFGPVRWSYTLFLPAWSCLATSIWYGTRAQQVYLAYMLLGATTIEGATRALNSDISDQVFWMRLGLLAFFIWLVIFLFWWIITKDAKSSHP